VVVQLGFGPPVGGVDEAAVGEVLGEVRVGLAGVDHRDVQAFARGAGIEAAQDVVAGREHRVAAVFVFARVDDRAGACVGLEAARREAAARAALGDLLTGRVLVRDGLHSRGEAARGRAIARGRYLPRLGNKTSWPATKAHLRNSCHPGREALGCLRGWMACRPSTLRALLVVAAFGFLWAKALGLTQFADPRFIDWMIEGDWMGHLFGWLFTRNGPWALALAQAPDLVAPAGSSAAMTDAIPLLSVVGKLLSPLFVDRMQLFGLWMVTGVIGTGITGVLVLRAFPSRLHRGGLRLRDRRGPLGLRVAHPADPAVARAASQGKNVSAAVLPLLRVRCRQIGSRHLGRGA